MEKVSFIFPVYKKGNTVQVIKKLREDPYANKEFIITVCQPDQEYLREIEKIKDKDMKILISNERKGKVNAVNEAVKYSSGDIIVFFDSDATLESFKIKDVVNACKKYELVDFVKKVNPSNIIGKFMYIEYFCYYLIQKLCSKIGKSIILNGAGFAVRREIWEKLNGYERVYIEDVDFATRLYANGGKYYLLDNCILKINPIKSWKKFIEQRKRWAYGGIEWFLRYYKVIIGYSLKHPEFPLFFAIFIIPILPVYILFTLFYSKLFENILFYILITLSVRLYPLLFIVVPLTVIISLARSLFFCIFIYLTFLSLYEFLHKKFVGKFLNPLHIFGYVFIYSTIYFITIMGVLIYYILFRRPPKIDWKV